MEYVAKLKKIKVYSGKNQTELAQLLGVSFPTFNSWINGKSVPRKNAQESIDALYIQYTGDLTISPLILKEKEVELLKIKKMYPDPFSLLLSQKDIYDTLLLSMTYHTNSIEGSTFNEPEVRAVLFDDVTIPHKTVREHQEVKNHQGALSFVVRWIRDEKSILTEKVIKNIHAILMNGIMHNAGQYRTHSVRIAGSPVVTSNYMKIEENMKSFVKEYNTQTKDIVAHIARTHANFERIHPFSDGNGRVGRLLILILALKNNLAPVIIVKEKKIAYYNYLAEYQLKDNDIPLTSFIYDALFEGYRLLK